jgi:hypothetical protein
MYQNSPEKRKVLPTGCRPAWWKAVLVGFELLLQRVRAAPTSHAESGILRATHEADLIR